MPWKDKLLGERDSRGMQGIFARGSNVYNGGTSAAHSGGGPQFGRPTVKKPSTPSAQPMQGDNPYMAAIRRRLLRGQHAPVA